MTMRDGFVARVTGSVVALAVVFALSAGAVSAQSPSASMALQTPTPSPPLTPSPSTRPDCAWLAGLLPAVRGDVVLGYGVKHGAETVSPSDVLDPLLLVLGIQLEDLCQVVFSYGDTGGGKPQLLQFRDADPATLADVFVRFLVKLYAGYEQTLADATATISGRSVRTLTDEGSPGQVIYIYQVGDALLLSGDRDLMAFLLPTLPPPGEPVPEVSAPPMAPAESPPSSPAG